MIKNATDVAQPWLYSKGESLMHKNQIIQAENDRSDRYLVCFIFLMWIFMFFVWLLNAADIFIVEKSHMNFVIVSVTFIELVIFALLKRKSVHGSCNKYRYIASVLLNITVGIYYSILTFHTILMFIFPLLVISIYGNKKLSVFTSVLSSLTIIISHYLSVYVNAVPQEPFTELNQIMLFGMLPRLIQYIMFSFILIRITSRNHSLIDRLQKYADEVYETQNEIVRSLAEISESKSGQTGSHVKRVSEYVKIMAEELNIDEDERDALTTAAMLHDIGKLCVPSEILDKPGKLTVEEFEIIKLHVRDGYKLLENSTGRIMEIGKIIALEHHERWDGKGYLGKSGDNIDYYARIMSIADVFDALVSKRSYKEKWEPEDAKNEILAQRGEQFDPQLVDVFERCYPKFIEVYDNFPD